MARFDVRRWFRSIVGGSARTVHRKKTRRPLLEELEIRETPALLVWDGSASGAWSDPQNWNNNPANTLTPGNGDTLVFPAGGANPATNNDVADLTLARIEIAGNGYTLSGNGITLHDPSTGTGFIILNGAGIAGTVNFDITLGGDVGDKQFFDVNSSTSVLTINGVVSGSTELSKDGTGILVLTGDNANFTGPATIVQGSVNIRHANALGDPNAPTTVLFNTTTGEFGQLQVQNIGPGSPVAERLVLNGTGPLNDGALLNVAGDNIWTGLVTLGQNTTIGSNLDSLTIQGVITDVGAGHSLTKEGPAKVILDPLGTADGNTYRGRTFVNAGILTIRHSHALGNETTPVFGVNDTLVNSTPDRSGTLQLEFVPNPARIDSFVNAGADGFFVPHELLTLHGYGHEGIHILPKEHEIVGGFTTSGALNNLSGVNTWEQDIGLWSGNSSMVFDNEIWDWRVVGIGAEAGTTLFITGHIHDDLITGSPGPFGTPTIDYSLAKLRPGRVILVTDNTYRGRTEVLEGYLNIRDSFALGRAGVAQNGTIVFPGGTLELEADDIPDSTPALPQPDGTPHLDTDIVITAEQIQLMGNGAGGDGALRNILGTNEVTGGIPLLTFLGRGFSNTPPAAPRPVVPRVPNPPPWFRVTFSGAGATVGVEPDRAPFDQFDLSQLTLSGIISGSNLTKVGEGELVLTDSANTYTGNTFILEGWVTIRNDRSLGADFVNFPDTLQPPTFVAQGAALHVKQTRAAVPISINVPERVFLSGNGISHRFPEIHQRGVLLNLSGINNWTGIVNLVSTADFGMVGIGADIADSPWVPADQAVTLSTLSFTNHIQQTLSNQANVLIGIANPPALIPSGINKLGRKRVQLQGMGTFTGNNQVTEGVLRVQADTALGMLAGATTVLDGAAIELKGYATQGTANTLGQWASTAIASSEFSTTQWAATQATGAPNVFVYQDDPNAWSPLPTNGTIEWLELGYTTPVFANSITVRETLGNGFVFQIDVIYVDDTRETVWTGVDPSAPGTPVDFSVSFPTTTQLVKGVRVWVDTDHDLTTWEEIDAVLLQGITAIPQTISTFNGGLPGGIQLFENLVLHGMGNDTADNASHDLAAGSNVRVDTLTNISDDNMVRTPITFATDVAVDTRLDSRLTLWKPIDGVGGFTKNGSGKLVLGGVNSYQGDTFVNTGTLNLQSSSALGTQTRNEQQAITVVGTTGSFSVEFDGDVTAPLPVGAPALDVQTAINGLLGIQNAGGSVTVSFATGVYTVIFSGGTFAGKNQIEMTAEGFDGASAGVATLTDGGGGTTVINQAQIELQGDITISGESLTILGNGPDASPDLPLRWFATGPSPINNPTWSGDSATGKITAVYGDPNDANILYAVGAGGGAWRSKNSGLTWQPLIDNVNGNPVDPSEILFSGAIAVAPTDSNVIYVGLGDYTNSTDPFAPVLNTANTNAFGEAYYGRGVLKSTDFGATWTLIQPPGNLFDGDTISRIVVDPVERDTVYVAVQGNGVNGSTPGDYGIWRQRNGVWVNLTAVTDPMPPILFTSAHRFTDFMVFNANPFATNGNSDGRHPNQPNRRIIAFALGNLDGGVTTHNAVYTAIDGDVTNNTPTWTLNGFPNGGETVAGVQNQPRNGMIKITGVRSNANFDQIRVYAAVTYPYNELRRRDNQAGIFREILTATHTWDTNNLVWGLGGWGGSTNPGALSGTNPSRGWRDSTIAVQSMPVVRFGIPLSVGNPNFAFVGGVVGAGGSPGPFVFDGTNWIDVDPSADGKGPHVGYHASGFDRTGRLIVGSDGGIWRMEGTAPPTSGAAVTWTNLNGNFLQVTQFNSLDVHPFDPFYAVGGTQDNGTIIYDDNFLWNSTDVTFQGAHVAQGGSVYFNNKDPNIIFHVQGGGIPAPNGRLRRSMDGGQTWQDVYTLAFPGNTFQTYFPMILDRVNPFRVLLGDGTDLRESLANGAPGSFNVIGASTSGPSGLGFIRRITVADRQGPWVFDPSFPLVVDNGADSYDSDTIYVLTSTGIQVTKNHGTAWVTRNTGLNLTGIEDIIVDPRNRDVAYVVRSVFGGFKVYKTTNAGQNWFPIDGTSFPDVPAWSLEINPRNGDVYVGTDIGVFYLPEGNTAGNWLRFGEGLPNAQVKDLVYNSYTNMLSAATYGRGLFQVWLDDSRDNGGAIRAVTGSSLWSGDIIIKGDIDIRAEIGATVNFAGVIQDDVLDADYTIDKFGLGRVVFSGANTYGGLTNVHEGALTARNPSALGQSDVETVVHDGAALELQADLFGETVILNGDGININGHNTGALRNVSNFNTFTGTLVLNTNSTIGVDSGSQLTIGTTAGDPDGLANGVGAIVEVDGPRDLDKELTGTLVLNSANSYTGLTDIIQGVLRVEHALALGTTDAGTDVRNGAQLQVNSGVFGIGITVVDEALRLSGTGIFGSGAILNFGGDNTWQGPVTLTSLPGIPAPPPPTPPANIGMGANLGTTLTIDGTIDEFAGVFGIVKVGLGKIVFTGEEDNAYFGTTTVQAGVLNIQKAGALGSDVSAGTTVLSGAALELEDPTGAGIVYLTEFLTLNGPGVASQGNLGALRNVDGNNEWTGDVLLATSSGIGVDDGTQLTVTGNVGGGLAAALTKVGTGTLVFPTDNTYDGATVVNQGVLNIRDPLALGNGTPDVNGATVLDGATLQVQGGITVSNETLTLNGLGFFGQGALANAAGDNTWAGPIILGSNASIGVTNAPERLTVTGAITDNGNAFGVTKLGPGTLAYAGSNNSEYTGLTRVNQGVLLLNKTTDAFNFDGNLQVGADFPTGNGDDSAVVRLGGNNQIPDNALTRVFADGLLDLDSFDESINSLLVSDGHVTTDAGALTVTTLTMVGGEVELNSSAGSLVLAGLVQATSSPSETAQITGPGLIDLNGADRVFAVTDGPLPNTVDLRIGAAPADTTALVGTGVGIVKDASGLMEIATTTSTYDGATTINAGDLRVSGAIASDVVLSGGTLSGTGAVAAISFDASNNEGGVVQPGAGGPGILTATDDVSWNGATVFFVELDDDDANPATPATAGTEYDRLHVNGDLSIGGASLAGSAGAGAVTNASGPGQSFTIITFTGAWDGAKFAEGDDVFISGKKFLIHYNANDVTLERDFSDVTITITPLVTALPAPTSTWSQHVVFLIEVANEDGAPVFDGEQIQITLTGPHSPGTITRTLTGGQYIYDPLTDSGIQNLEIGVHTVTVNFAATPDYNGGTNAQTHEVLRANTAIALGINANPGVFGQTMVITATITALPPGSAPTGIGGVVDFFIDGSLVGDNVPVVQVGSNYVATFNISTLALGNHQVGAAYSGHDASIGTPADNHFNPVQTPAPLDFSIVKANSTVTIAGNPSPSQLNENVVFTVTVSATAPGSGTPTGSVSIFRDGQPFGTSALTNGQASFNVSTLTIGLHTITATYSGDANFNMGNGTAQHVVRGNSNITSLTTSLNPSTYGQNVTFRATVAAVLPATGTPTGSVDFVFTLPGGGTFTQNVALTSGVAQLSKNDLPAGTSMLTANYLGDQVFGGSSRTLSPNQVINKANTATTLLASPGSPTVFGQNIVFTATVSQVAPSGLVPTGNVEFLDGTNVIGTVALSAGVATFSTSTLGVGSHSITARYVGTSDYNASTSAAVNRNVNIAGTTTNLVVSANPSFYGQQVVTATVAANAPSGAMPTGNVVFAVQNRVTLATTNVTVALVGGVATLPPQPAGDYRVTANYQATSGFAASSDGPEDYDVDPAPTTLTLASTNLNAVYGEAAITATVVPNFGGVIVPSGNVIFTVNGNPHSATLDANGVATLPLVLSPGTYTITAAYGGDTNFLADNDGPITQNVAAADTQVTVSDDPSASVFGQSVTFTITVAAVAPGQGIPSGTVDIFDGPTLIGDNVPLVGGVATLTTNTLTVGSHTISADYDGDGNFNGDDGTDIHVVSQASTATTIVPSANPSDTGAVVQFDITVAVVAPGVGTPIGTVDVFIGGNLVADNLALVGGSATVLHQFAVAGDFAVQVVYSGNTNFAASNNTLTQMVRTPTTTTIVAADDTTVFGEPANFTITVTGAGGPPTGTVDVFDGITLIGDDVPLAGGTAQFTVDNLGVGSHTINAFYNGDGFFKTSNDSTTQTVSQGTTTTTVQADDADSVFGQTVTFTATVSPSAPSQVVPTGTVTFTVDGNPVATINLVGGVATFQVNSLAVGSHSVQAIFNGTANYAGSSDTTTQEVATADTNVDLTSSLNPSFFQQNVTFTATVSVAAPGSLIGAFAGTVTFTIDGNPVATVNVVGGQATFSTSTLSIGLHTVAAVYNGDPNYNPSAADTLVQDVDANPITFASVPASVRSGAFFTVIVHYLGNGNAPDPTFNGPVTIALQSNPGGGVLAGTRTVNAVGGVATFTGLSINRAANGYTLRATAPTIPAVVSSALNVTASRLAAVAAPKRPDVNQRFRITLSALDVTSNVAANFNANFQAKLLSKPAGARVRGRLTGAFVDGVATLANLRANVPGKYKFRIISNGLAVNVLINVRGRRLS